MKLLQLLMVSFVISIISCNNYQDAEKPMENVQELNEQETDPDSTMDDDPKNDIKVLAYLTINDGKENAFQKASAACINAVKEKDSGTIVYDWYYNDSRSTSVVIEHYANATSFMDHMSNVADELGPLLESCSISLEVFGNATEEIKAALDGLDVTYYSLDSGI